jgi:predicted DNA-binding transcriptional regulator YafY
MATNKHATIRYHALDRCFSNYARKFFIEDLINACNDAIYEFAGIKDGIKRRQLFDDITFMESEQGWSISLDRIKDGRRTYYRYSDKSFSIRNQGINQSEAEQLKETLEILSRFKGLPHFEWVEEIQIRLEDTFKLKGNLQEVVGFEHNPYLRGLNFFSDIFNAIKNNTVLQVEYHPFNKENSMLQEIHPYYLKQFNNRWFLFGYNDDFWDISNLAIDRIKSIKELRKPFNENKSINFEEYFEDVVGVTINKDKPSQKITFNASSTISQYIQSKPIHGSQKKISTLEDGSVVFELNVQINYELIALLFSYVDNITILSPDELRLIFKEKLKKTLQNYD